MSKSPEKSGKVQKRSRKVQKSSLFSVSLLQTLDRLENRHDWILTIPFWKFGQWKRWKNVEKLWKSGKSDLAWIGATFEPPSLWALKRPKLVENAKMAFFGTGLVRPFKAVLKVEVGLVWKVPHGKWTNLLCLFWDLARNCAFFKLM